MDFSQMGAAGIIGSVIAAVILMLIGALILSLVNRIINGFWAHYGRALGTVVVVVIIDGIINWGIGKIVGVDHFWVMLVIGIVVETLVGGAVMGAFVRRNDGSPLGFKHAVRVFFVLAILGALLGIASHQWLQPWAEAMRANMPTQ